MFQIGRQIQRGEKNQPVAQVEPGNCSSGIGRTLSGRRHIASRGDIAGAILLGLMAALTRTVRLLTVALLVVSTGGAPRAQASDPRLGDWPMWGGTPSRNMVSPMKGLPVEWDPETRKNVKWVADLGDHSYGNPVVAGGRVFVGTNNKTGAIQSRPATEVC